jgi:hypothetical protein
MVAKLNVKHCLLTSLLLGMTAVSFATDSTTVTSPSPLTPMSNGYVLATGWIQMPYQSNRSNYQLNISPPNGKPCPANMPAYITVSINEFNIFNNWHFGNMSAFPYNITNPNAYSYNVYASNLVYDPHPIWDPGPPANYVSGVLLYGWVDAERSSVGVTWTLYCLPSNFSYQVW